MLSENIKKYRKLNKMSQEDLAIQMHVVRQTLSKWENSLSVPDADQLISLAAVLGVSADDLLGTEIVDADNSKDIAKELAKANEQIARYTEEERLRKESEKTSANMLWLTIVAIVTMHIFRNGALAITLSSVLLVAVLIILYRNISLLSISLNSTGKTGSIKVVTMLNIALGAVIGILGILLKINKIHFIDSKRVLFAPAMLAAIMIFIGIIAPRLPYNRHTGLRLPWTVQNESAWTVAHKVLGIISIPLSLIYLSLVFYVSNLEILSLITVGIWIGVPGLISLLYMLKAKESI